MTRLEFCTRVPSPVRNGIAEVLRAFNVRSWTPVLAYEVYDYCRGLGLDPETLTVDAVRAVLEAKLITGMIQ